LNRFYSNDNKILASIIIIFLVVNTIFIAAFIGTLFTYINSRTKRKLIQQDMHRDTFKSLQSLEEIYSSRTILSASFLELVAANKNQIDLTSVDSAVDNFMNVVVENTKQFFEIYTSDKCSVSIVLITQSHIDGEEDVPYVFTYKRDAWAVGQRGILKQPYNYYKCSDHTPFFDLLRDNRRMPHFVCNDLKLHSEYQNTNPNWPSWYNAKCVVPIKNPIIHQNNDQFIGFLCVDNFDGKFDERVCPTFLRNIANDVYYIISTRNIIASNAQRSHKADKKTTVKKKK